MNEQGLLLVLAAAAGLWAAIVLARLLVAVLQLVRLRFGVGGAHPADRSAMPADVAAVLDDAAARLAALGFAVEETCLVESMLRTGQRAPDWSEIHCHAATGCRATVRLSDSPEPGTAAAVVFSTRDGDRELQTVNRCEHMLLPAPPGVDVADAGAATLADHWAFHRRRTAALAAAIGPERDAPDRRERARNERQLASLVASGFVRRVGDEWRMTVRGAVRFLRQVIAGRRRLAAMPPPAEIEDLALRVAADARAWQAQEAINAANAMSRAGKVFWFALSATAGAAAFAYLAASWTLVPLILGVLLFHEFGHALAMRALGYRALSVLVLPFLGAVAIGRKDDAGPWQKLAVLIAGPLPGLVVAVACLRVARSDAAHHPLLFSFGTIALVINLFNLLPLTPLDGGQIVDTFLLARRPRLRLGFFAVSAFALIGVGVALGSTVVAAAGVLLAFAMRAAQRRLRLLASLGPIDPQADPAVAIFRQLQMAAGPRWPSFAQRYQTVRALLPQLRGRAPALRDGLGGMAVYLATIVLPIVLLWDTGQPQQLLAMVAHGRPAVPQARAAPPDWNAALARAKTPQARWSVLWQAGQWFEDHDDEERARARYVEALAEATNLAAGEQRDLHVADTRLALARVSDADAARAAYAALIPDLRRLAPAERWRLADALELQDDFETGDASDARLARLQEAIAVREADDTLPPLKLIQDRIDVARLLDERGETAAAEALLRRNLQVATNPARGYADWQFGPLAWFLMAHDRAREAEELLTAQPVAQVDGAGRLRATLAWAQLVQGETQAARAVLGALLTQAAVRRNAHWQQLELALDLAHASRDAPGEQARWDARAAELELALRDGLPVFLESVRREAASGRWEAVRARARMAVLQRLPGSGPRHIDAASAPPP